MLDTGKKLAENRNNENRKEMKIFESKLFHLTSPSVMTCDNEFTIWTKLDDSHWYINGTNLRKLRIINPLQEKYCSEFKYFVTLQASAFKMKKNQT